MELTFKYLVINIFIIINALLNKDKTFLKKRNIIETVIGKIKRLTKN